MDKFFAALIIVFIAAMFFGISNNTKRTAEVTAWCESRGYEYFEGGRGPRLCMDPKTRQVFRPE